MAKLTILGSLVAASLIAATAANTSVSFAADKGGVKVGGNLTQTTYVKNATNTAFGDGAKAVLSIGAIHGKVDIGGNLTQTTTVGSVLNHASGKDALACTFIGSIGDGGACD